MYNAICLENNIIIALKKIYWIYLNDIMINDICANLIVIKSYRGADIFSYN